MALVQAILRNIRRRKRREAEAAEDVDPMATGDPDEPVLSKRLSVEEKGIISGKLAFNKSLLVERLILEEAICFQLGRSFLFITQFVILMIAFWLSYPAPTVLPIHQGLAEGLSIDGVMPEDVVTLNGLKDYLKGLSDVWRTYSPGSSVYSEDPMARSYIASPTETPPAQVVQEPQQPQLGGAFTVMAWIKTRVRYDTLLKKVQPSFDDAVCWQFDMERILYGQHETGQVEAVIHPAAKQIWSAGVNAATAWKSSAFRSQFQDGEWHHWAVVVDGLSVTFALDGEFYSEVVQLPRPITDCQDGVMTLGSSSTQGRIVDIKYIPRRLRPVELQFIRNKGKLLDDMLAGAGQPAVAEQSLDALRRMVRSGVEMGGQGRKRLQAELMTAFRKLERVMQGSLTGTSARRLQSLDASSSVSAEQATETNNSVFVAQAASQGAGTEALPESLRRHGQQSQAQPPDADNRRTRQRSAQLLTDLLAGRSTPKAAAEAKPPPRLGFKAAKAAAAKLPAQAMEAAARRVQQERGAGEVERRLDVCEDSLECGWQMISVLLSSVRTTTANEVDVPLLDCISYQFWATGDLYLTHDKILGPWPDSIINPPNGACNSSYAAQETSQCSRHEDCAPDQCADAPPHQYALGCHNGQCSVAVPDDACDGQPTASADCDLNGGAWRRVPCPRKHLRRKLAEMVQNVEFWFCNSESLAPICMQSCSRCMVSTAPSEQSTMEEILRCSDASSYQDWMGQSCSWYFFNDPPTSTDGACTRYGTDLTRTSCRLSCEKCRYAERLIAAYDQNGDGRVNAQETGALFLNLDRDVVPARFFDVLIPVNDLCAAIYGDPEAASDCVASRHLFRDSSIEIWVLLHPASGVYEFFDEAARDLVRRLRPVSNFLGLQSGTEVLRFPSALRLTGSRNMALQGETAAPAFEGCSVQADCQGETRYACGNAMQARNSLCSRRVAVPLYCATRCFTGGCGSDASVLPGAPGSFCQPCDACFADAGVGACPDWCNGYRVDAAGGYTANPHAADPGNLDYVHSSTGDQPGSFTLMAWVKNFENQWVFERRINLTSAVELDSSWEGFDARTGELACWQLGESELRYRSHWSQRSMTVVDNPLKQVFASNPDAWHFLVLRKDSILDAGVYEGHQTTTRREQLRFFVDDAQSELVVLPWGDARVDVPPYGFPDCGGEMLSIPSLAAESVNAPMDISSTAPWNWAGDRGIAFTGEHYFPLAQGRNGMASFTFTNLQLPRGALIKTAQLSLCAGRNFLDWLDQNLTCGSRHPSEVRLRIAGLMNRPESHHNEGFCQIAHQAGHLATNGTDSGRTATEVVWKINVAQWKERALVQSMFNWDVEPYSEDCTVVTPDVSPIIAEMLDKRPDLSDLTLVFKQEGMGWGDCPSPSIFEYTPPFYSNWSEFDAMPEEDACDIVRKYNEVLNYAVPLFIIPREDNTNQRSSVTTLSLQYCLNQECVSPAFLGSGVTATIERRRLVETTQQEAADQQPGGSGNASVVGSQSLTSIQLGVPLDQGMTSNGMLYAPVHVTRALADSEVQRAYYQGLLAVQRLTGPLPLVDAVTTASAKVDQYPSEVVSIIPAVVFQTRSKIVPCKDFAPGLSASMDQYFYKQVRMKCEQSYTCEYPDFAADSATPSGFACIDRSQGMSTPYLGTEALEDEGELWYPEFLDLFSVPTVLRDGAMRETEDWIDVQTSKVAVLNVFISPSLRSGTLLSIAWEYTGPGRLKGQTTMRSYVQMDPNTRETWAALTFVVIALAVLDVFLIIFSWIARARERSRLLKELPKATQEERITIKQNMPIVEPLDLFDVALRVVNVVFSIIHYLHYPGPEFIQIGGEELRLDRYDSMIKDILALSWDDPMRSTNDKVDEFMSMVVRLQSSLSSDVRHRDLAKALVLAFFVRAVVYTRVHPRIAILYKTLVVMMEDFMHFAILFFMLYFVLAFLGTYSFGDQNPDFADFGVTCYTQFRMICGEFNLADGAGAGFDIIFGTYVVCYFFFSFSLLLNFFLAIVIDSYSHVIDKVKECNIEHMVIWDIPATLIYPIRALLAGYPQRGRLLKRLLRSDLNLDGKNDEAAMAVIPVRLEHLVSTKVVPSMRVALGVMKHYQFFCPTAVIGHEEKAHGLEHQALQKRINTVDAIRAKYISEEDASAGVNAVPRGNGPPADAMDSAEDSAEAELNELVEKIADAVTARMGSRV